MPFVVLSLRPIFCSVDISLSSLIADINWCSHLFQYSRLLLCCLTRLFQAVTYSLRKNSFNSHEVYLQVFVVTSLTLVIVESRARGFWVLRYLRWRNGKLPKLRLLPATLASLARSASSAVSSAGGSLTIHWACTNLWTSEWTFHNFFVDCPWSKNRGSWPLPPVRARAPSSVVFLFLNSRKRIIWLESLFCTMLEKKKYYESRNGRHVYSTPQMLSQSRTKWGHNRLSVPKNELRVGHKLRKTLLYKLSSRANIQAFC